MKSIIQDESKRVCFICGGYGSDRHHCLHGTANRKLAEKWGLWVFLCHYCHMLLHDKGVNDKYLQQVAEKKWLETTGRTVEEFIKIFGKNYI